MINAYADPKKKEKEDEEEMNAFPYHIPLCPVVPLA
jgi:hypothetical protein